MGRQIRKVAPWLGMVESHLHSNHTIHRLYRWTTYHSHPKDRAGAPFKSRFWGRPTPGVLLTPDALKFHIPLPFAFVDANPSVNPRHTKSLPQDSHSPKVQLLSSGNFKNEINCQKTVNNFNKCIKNTNPDDCLYYMNYLKSNCKLTK
jgi:hypothetical protein